MSMLIQVYGRGLIPRGLGLAPRIEPFKADRTLIYTILSTPGLRIKYIHPETGEPKDLTNKNFKKVYDKWGDVNQSTTHKSISRPDCNLGPVIPEKDKPADTTPVVSNTSVEQTTTEVPEEVKTPVVPTEENNDETTSDHTKVEDKPEIEEKTDVFKPVMQPENGNQQQKGNNYQNNNKGNNQGKNNQNNQRK